MFFLEPLEPGAGPDLIFSASDLVTAAGCEYQVLRKLDEKLGRAPRADFGTDAMLQHAADLGDVHERKVLDAFVQDFGHWDASTGRGVYDVAPATSMDRDSLTAKHSESIEAIHAGADVVFQAAFFDGRFHGRSDFLRREADGSYAVLDTKLARHAKVTALLQLAAYADQLLSAGIKPAPQVTLILGATEARAGGGYDYVRSHHVLADLLPVFRERRERFLALTAAHRDQPDPVGWGQIGVAACGRCDYCQEQVKATDDLLLVARMTTAQRKKLHEQGIFTVKALAEASLPGATAAVRRYQEQARMQAGTGAVDGSVLYAHDGSETTLSYRVLGSNTLAELPPPSAGDIFFDFEGDPLWQDGATGVWGLEYLFGVVEAPVAPGGGVVFRPFWAHDRDAEKQTFLDFLEYVQKRRHDYPDMHVYHYAPYEKTALRKLSVMHVAGEEIVDEWLRDGLLVDLYQTVRSSLLISENSYSIKKLEPLYMGTRLRSGDVKDAGASVVAYAHYCAARDAGRADDAAAILGGIADYNEYDCLSTLRLRDWLLGLACKHGSPGSAGPDAAPASDEVARTGVATAVVEAVQAVETIQATATPDAGPAPIAAETALAEFASPDTGLPEPDRKAVAMLAAAVSYHRRERKAFWWAHFDRCENGPDTRQQDRNVFLVESGEILEDWRKVGNKLPERRVRLTGTLSPGSELREGSTWFRMYGLPLPAGLAGTGSANAGRNGWFGTEVLELGHEDGKDTVVIRDRLHRGIEPHLQLPIALSEDQPLATKNIEAALADLAHAVAVGLQAGPDPDGTPAFPRHPALDLLRRVPPRLKAGMALPAPQEGPDRFIDAITEAVAGLDHSYVAVQGPPGTGKTHVGSHVIARLVSHGWKVGVVGQSHAVVEHLLTTAVTKAGVDPGRVAKDVKHAAPLPWRRQSAAEVSELLASEGGALVGGTAWTMTGATIPAGSLDLLVIDEAGQFSLANTLAVAQASPRLLLLGDPQQLPQVSQGSHPEPVDGSALGWISAGRATLPADLGYFLADSWRMAPELCRAVSELAYEGRLQSAPAAGRRRLEGVPAGVAVVEVGHTGNVISSPEEAAEVVRQVRRHVGLPWHAEHGTRPLGVPDILVVAAYNAQVNLIRDALDSAGFHGVRVGTVDKFQGQEAAVVIVSLACSAVADAPRGLEFLLSRNRINVAVSRAQWRAVLVRSPELTNFLPARPESLSQLGGFIGLCQQSSPPQV